MKKSVFITACLIFSSFTLFSCASKETELPDLPVQELQEELNPEEQTPEELSADSATETDQTDEGTESGLTESSEESSGTDETENKEISEDENNSGDEDEVQEVEELEEIIEPEVFEEELPPEEPEVEIIDEEKSESENTEPLTEEETTEIQELPEVTEPEENKNTEENSPEENETEKVIEVSDNKADEVESLEEESTDEENKVSEEPAEEKVIVPSRTVSLKKGETLDVSYPGKGWIFLGAVDSSKNLTSTGRRTNAKTTDFSLMARVPGTVILHFYKEDILADKYIDDYLEVTVQDIKSKSTVHVKAPDYAEIVPAKPAAKTEEKTETVKAETAETVHEEAEKTVTPKTEPVEKPVMEVKKAEPLQVKKVETPSVKKDEPVSKTEPVSKPEPAAEKSALSADEYLTNAKKALNEKNFTEGYNNLQNFLLITEKNRDEGLFLLAGLYEGNSEYRNIKKSIDTYEELTENYPLSKYWDDANKRVIYLKRFYINIR